MRVSEKKEKKAWKRRKSAKRESIHGKGKTSLLRVLERVESRDKQTDRNSILILIIISLTISLTNTLLRHSTIRPNEREK